MKKNLIIFALLAMSTSLNAGVLGWSTSTVRDWDFIQRTGGIRIAAPVRKEGQTLLPVTYDVSGLTTVTHRPTLVNSGLAVRKIEARHSGEQILIRVVTQVFAQGAEVGPTHYADLSGIPAGKYQVWYETDGAGRTKLGEIDLQL